MPRTGIVVASALLAATIMYFELAPVLESSRSIIDSHTRPANATLGFGSIYAVSIPGSPRLESLLEAINVTGLEVRVPDLPDWTQEQVDYFRDDGHPDRSVILKGSIRAWMSHIAVLEEFLRGVAETALIIEDDVDWDIRLKTKQIPATAAALRRLTDRWQAPYWGSL
ncbi:Procollagen galactosyltransferase 1 [Sphaceloma murrayae]|uniref:Procollagen galactosyltransferase 1 n=1 Tax=Sphaceloma murrayae TaxID=2082308 RepID=A0A2K1QSD8_9PEZI|nr:Procollagen galactosyltransferase 1 [Sphaceloma murrayae]